MAGFDADTSNLQGRTTSEPASANTSVTLHRPPGGEKKSKQSGFQEMEVPVEHLVSRKKIKS